MYKKFFLLFFSLCTVICVKAQNDDEESQTYKTADEERVNGDLFVEVGFNRFLNAPASLQERFFGSKGVNIYYLHRTPLGGSGRFFFTPGIGFGLESHSFKNKTTILDTEDGKLKISLDESASRSYIKSKLFTNYLDVPLEFRYVFGNLDYRPMTLSIGGKIGYRLDVHSKVKFSEDGEKKKEKSHESFETNKFRYGVSARFTYGKIGIFGFYTLSDLFQKGKGPDVTPIMVGIVFNTL